MGQQRQFTLPDVGEGLVEAEIVKWHVRPGDRVEINQIIVEIETVKAVVELPCPFEGLVTEILVAEGTMVEVGTPIVTVQTHADEPAPPRVAGSSPVPAASDPAGQNRVPVLVGYGVQASSKTRRPRKTSTISPPAGEGRRAGSSIAVPATPPVRKLAKDLGVDLAAITGTGTRGSITRDDIRQASTATAQGAFTAPHVTSWSQVDMTETVEAVKRLRDLDEFDSLEASPLLLVAKALLLAAERNPMINACWTGPTTEIVARRDVNLGVSTATERGLVVTTVEQAQALSLPELARALTATAHVGEAPLRATITIINVGASGVDGSTPIPAPGQSAILALGRIRDIPWVHEGEIKIREVTTLALSFDHRVVDGELGSAVLREVSTMLEDPQRMIALS